MANELSFIGPQPVNGTTQPGDPGIDLVTQLLAGLEMAPQPEPPPELKTWQKVLGGLGDAIGAMAAVRSGGVAPPTGAFAAGQEQKRLDYEARAADAEAANRDMRNRIRLVGFEAGQKARTGADKARMKAEADEIKRTIDIEDDFRKSLRNKIVEKGIDTGDADLLTTSTADLKAILDAQDPTESLRSLVDTLPPDMELSRVHVNKDGSLSFEIGKKGQGKELPAGVISALIKSGVDPSGFIDDPQLAAAAKQAAEASKNKLLTGQADKFLDDVRRVASAQIETPTGEIDVVNQSIAAAAQELREMGAAGRTPEAVAAYYKAEADALGELVKAGDAGWSEQAATDYLTRLRQLIRVRFGDEPLQLLDRAQKAEAGRVKSVTEKRPTP